MELFRRLLAVLAVAAAGIATLVGSGGGGGDGGGGGGGGGGPTTYNLSGTINIAETAAVDSDTNDVNQSGYRSNGTAATAQALTAPVLLVGSVNLPNTGPRGNNFASGDADDVYRVDLVAGQVVELEFASDPAASDVDLYVITTDGTQGGQSIGEDTRFECVRATQSGTYYVLVNAFRGASIYNLRIGAPGTAASCAQATAPLAFIAGQLVAEPRRAVAGAAEKASALVHAAGARVGDGASTFAATMKADAGAQLVHLPTDPVASSDGLAALTKLAVGERSSVSAHDAAKAAMHDAARRAAAAASPEPAALATMRYAKRLRATGAFEYVELNRLMQTTALVGNFPPNDRAYSYQRWHYELINLPAAMQRVTALSPQPATRPVVAVIDDGVVLDHPDLQPQLFSPGRAFVSLATQGDADRADGDNISTAADEPAFHGTHVAGTVGAATYDGIGGAGTAPMALIMPLRVFPPKRGAASIDVIQAMRYAARLSNRSGQLPVRRADVINLSLGGDAPCDGAYQTAVNDARGAGVIVVAAAGNSGNNSAGRRAAVGSPANCNGVVAVSAVDAKRNLTDYSNTGTQIAVAAPGGDGSVSTTGNGAPDNVYSDVATFDAAGRRQPAFGGLQGTSMASPHVAGVMALMRFVNPGLTVAQVDALIANGAITDDAGTPGRDIDYGFGLINARKAVDAALAALGAPPPPQNAPVVALPSELNFGALVSTGVIELSAAGTTTETVAATQIVLPAGASAGAVTLAPPAGNASGLGRYTITIDRARFTGNGTFYPSINFTLNTARVLSVQLTVQKPAGGGGTAAGANFGPIYVLLIDPGTGAVQHTVLATLSAGRYAWSFTGYAKPRVAVVAGADLDNDDVICTRGEPCGAFPVLLAGERYQPIDLTGNRSDLNFQVAPLAGISPAAVAAETGRGPWRRQAVQMVPGAVDARP